MLAFRLFPFVQALIIIFCFIYPLKHINSIFKWVIGAILAVFSLKIYFFIFTNGTMMDPMFPRTTSFIIDCLYFSTIFVFLLTLVRMGANGLYKLVRFDRHKFVIPPSSVRFAFIILLVSFSLGTFGVINGFATPVDKNYTIKIENLNEKAHGFVIVHLTDLHISSPATEKEVDDIVNRTNAKNPDLILITGDLLDGKIENLDHLTKKLFNLKAKYGVYAVSGNHEYYSGYYEWIYYFNQGGIHFLENENQTIKADDGTALFNLVGISDVSGEKLGFRGDDIPLATKDLDKSIPTIFMSHQPKVADDIKEISDLTLSGHTHGGLMPGLKILVAAANKGYVSGYYRIGKEQLIVGNGTRIWAGAPLRLNTPSELITITLE